MNPEQVFVNMGYDPKQKKYGLIFTFPDKEKFCVNMSIDQLQNHIEDLKKLIGWSLTLPKDDQEWGKYPKVEAIGIDLNDK